MHEPGAPQRGCPEFTADDCADRHAIGLWDPGAILLILAPSATMSSSDPMMELHNQHAERTGWTTCVHGRIAGCIPWAVILPYFAGG
jgi:hypothetical protein